MAGQLRLQEAGTCVQPFQAATSLPGTVWRGCLKVQQGNQGQRPRQRPDAACHKKMPCSLVRVASQLSHGKGAGCGARTVGDHVDVDVDGDYRRCRK